MDVSPLFRSLRVRGKVLPNRVVMPPMVALRGLTTLDGVEWYGQHASGGVGLVIVQATSVGRFGSELTESTLAPLVDAIHEGGALAAIQLFPVDRGRAAAPSDLDVQEIDRIVDQYRIAAEVCRGAGFDGIEPHGAHGYLLNQFFSPVRNGRSDEHGGRLVNRMRLALRIVRTVRPVCGSGMFLLYRHTPVGPGYDVEESLILAEALVGAGVDILDMSPSSLETPGDRAGPFRKLGVPVIAVGELDRVERAIQAIEDGKADLIAIGRGLIADPQWPVKVREGRLDEIVRCVRCDEKCFGNLREGIPIACSRWDR